MPIFSVVTAVYDGGDAHLSEAYESVAGQRLPKGWSLQWLVQEQGGTGKALDGLPDRPWISTGAGATGGTAGTRTLALERAEGVLTRTLDADGSFPDESVLARDIEALAANPDLCWTLAPVFELHADGRLVPDSHEAPTGRLPSGFVVERARMGRLPVTVTAATIYTELVVAHGGWPVLPPFEELGLLLAVEAVADGWMQEKPGGIVRKHSGLRDAGPEHGRRDERTRRLGVVLDRADAIRELGWTWRPADPVTIQ
jgi:hypothetical protein